MNRVFVLDRNKQPLMPCHPARARELMREGKAALYRLQPFTIILHEREGGDAQPVEVKTDPGSKTTGIALVGDFKRGKRVIWAANLAHRGRAIKDALESRASLLEVKNDPAGNGGVDFLGVWATLVDSSGRVCAVVSSDDGDLSVNSELAHRIFSAHKANSANSFSNSRFTTPSGHYREELFITLHSLLELILTQAM